MNKTYRYLSLVEREVAERLNDLLAENWTTLGHEIEDTAAGVFKGKCQPSYGIKSYCCFLAKWYMGEREEVTLPSASVSLSFPLPEIPVRSDYVFELD